ncbi:MAG: hypothetical protein ACE37H_06650 [Phycisphaeraceae bacterium]
MNRFDPIRLNMLALLVLTSLWCTAAADAEQYAVTPPTAEQLAYYDLDPAFYKKSVVVQDILIATSDKVSDYALKESAYLFDKMMQSIDPDVAQRVRDKKLLCLLVGATELTSDLPQFKTDKTGDALDYYNWRSRGFLTSRRINDRKQPIVLFAEEDVLEYPGGMQDESILIHEFGHVVMFQGFNDAQMKQVTACFENAREKGLYMDGFACQRFGRVEGDKPVRLLDALAESFPDQPRALLYAALAGGDITVNGRPATPYLMVDGEDDVLIKFGGPKDCYAVKNRAEYFAEIFQAWYDTNRTMDHDHNHIHTRSQLKAYDPMGAKLCEQVLGDGDWRFVSPRLRAGTGHLKGYDPASAPTVTNPPNIRKAGLDYYDAYWAPYWQRLHEKYAEALKDAGEAE